MDNLNKLVREKLVLIDSILSEEQNFNFEPSKELIIRFINKIKKGERIGEFDNPFYTILVGSPEVGSANKLGFDNDFKNKWKEFFSNNAFITDGVWSQRSFNSKLPRKTGNDRTLNYYVTINKSKDNILKFMSKLSIVDNQLSQLSNDKQSPISYKTHRLLDAFLGHNDSFKVYYYDSALKNDIESIVNTWLNTNGIQQSDRTHAHGVDIKGDNGGSFGRILANKIGEVLASTIKQYGNKYSDEQYYEWVKLHMSQIIKSVKVSQ